MHYRILTMKQTISKTIRSTILATARITLCAMIWIILRLEGKKAVPLTSKTRQSKNLRDSSTRRKKRRAVFTTLALIRISSVNLQLREKKLMMNYTINRKPRIKIHLGFPTKRAHTFSCFFLYS